MKIRSNAVTINGGEMLEAVETWLIGKGVRLTGHRVLVCNVHEVTRGTNATVHARGIMQQDAKTGEWQAYEERMGK